MKGAVVEWTQRVHSKLFVILRGSEHHGRLVIRCDQEAALKSLVGEVARMRGGAVHDFVTHCSWRFTRERLY